MPKKPPTQLKPPRGLTRDERKEFNRIKSALIECGFQATIDEAVLLAYLQTVATFKKARAEQAELTSLVVTTPNGAYQTHPVVTIVRQQSELIKKLAQELAFSPGARKRLGIELGSSEDDDPHGIL